MRLRTLSLILAVSAFPLVGCRSMPATHYYMLAPPAANPAEASTTGLDLGIEPFRVDPPYDTDEVVYRMGPDALEVGFYAYHRWSAPLGHLVASALADGLRGTEGLARVEPASALREYDAVLRGRVICLEELDRSSGQEARIEVEVEWVVDGEVRWHHRVKGQVTGQAEEVAEILVMMQGAFSQVVAELRESLPVGSRDSSGD